MTRKKAFWLSFACTLGVLIPIYAAALFFGTAHLGSPDAAAAGEGVGIAVRRPDAGDSHLPCAALMYIFFSGR